MDVSRTFCSNYSIDANGPGFVSTTSSTPVTVSGLSVTITTTGRPVMVGLCVSPDNYEGYIEAAKQYDKWCGGYIYIKSNSTIIAQYKIQNYIDFNVPNQGVGSIATQGINNGTGQPNSGITAGANSGIAVDGIDAIITLPLSIINTLDISAASTRTYTIQYASINGSTIKINNAIMYAYEI
jgi:hypothetical protein